MKRGLLFRLMVLMFLESMIVPTWFNTVVPYVRTLDGGETWVPLFGSLMGIGVFASPIICMLADRFWDSGHVLAICNAMAAVLLSTAFFVRTPSILFLLSLLAMLAIMPTWSLSSALAMAHVSAEAFPYIRVCGSIGWAASAIFSLIAIRALGCMSFDKSPWIFACAAVVSLAASGVSLCQPPTPPRAKGSPMSIIDALGLKSLVLLKNRQFLLFSMILLLGMIAFQWYFGYNTMYLDEVGFRYLNLVQNAGQLFEIGFMLLIPYLMRKHGLKYTLVIGFVALAFRYAVYLFSFKADLPVCNLAGILVHGLIFGTLIVGAQMHVAKIAPDELRNQAQGFVMILTTGIGGFLSIAIFESVLRFNRLPNNYHNWTTPFIIAMVLSITAAILAVFLLFPRRKSP